MCVLHALGVSLGLIDSLQGAGTSELSLSTDPQLAEEQISPKTSFFPPSLLYSMTSSSSCVHLSGCFFCFLFWQCVSLYPLWARPVPSIPVPFPPLPAPAHFPHCLLFILCFILALQANGHSFLHIEHQTAVSLLKSFPKAVDMVILRESTM